MTKRFCDKCKKEIYIPRPNVTIKENIPFLDDDGAHLYNETKFTYDLCEECIQKVKEFIKA